jgi:1,2-diacylglycerol 3-alpha-glucosyltransferase
LALVPYGLDCAAFARSATSRMEARARLGLPEAARVMLTVAPLGYYKRVDYLIRELASLGRSDLFLLVAGQPAPETPALERMAKQRLAGQYRFVTLPYSEVQLAYQAADLFALCSLREGLGRAILEAMAASVPVLVHDWPLFEWLVPDASSRVNMELEGALAARLDALLADPAAAQQLAEDNLRNVRSRFDWSSLKPAYLRMYDTALELPPLNG